MSGMSALNRRLWRDLWHLGGQVAALTLVVACGIASFITMYSAYRALVVTRGDYYSRYRFPDLFVQAKRAPESLAARIKAIPGVAAVETRVVVEALLDVPGLAEPATARLISIPARPRTMLNDLFFRTGSYVDTSRRGEVLVSEAFTSANRLNVGDTLDAVINGRWEKLRIAGIALSPEYVYEIRGGEVLPDNRRFGVFWMNRDVLGPAYDMDGAFNDASVSLAPGASEGAVAAEIDRLLEPYGGRGSYGRDEQVSNRFLEDEIGQDRITGIFVPAIFLAVAAGLIHIVLSRLVSTQRNEIGLMKAFGYSHWAVGWSYSKFAMLAVSGGALGGVALGSWLGRGLANMYRDFFRFPELRFQVGPGLVVTAFAIAYGAAVMGAWTASRKAASLPPAEAMRPESPPLFRAGLIERFHWIAARIPLALRMILRNLDRRRGKAILSVTGIMLAVAIMVVGRFFFDSLDWILLAQFTHVSRENAVLWLNEPSQARTRHAIQQLPGVQKVESFRVVQARLHYEHRRRRLAIVGLQPDPDLHRVISADLVQVDVPEEGVVLSEQLAEVLGVHPGESITVEVLEGQRPVREVRVAGTVRDMIGMSAFMDIRALNRLMLEGGTISGAYILADPIKLPELYRELKRMPNVAGIVLLDAMRESFVETIAKSLNTSLFTLVTFACIIAFGIVYNSARVSLSERGHELASLRVLGFTQAEIAAMLLGEQVLLTLVAIPAGFAAGYGISALLVRAMATELYRMPLVVSSRTYAFAFLIVGASTAFSSLLIARRLRKLDLVAVLKTRE